MCFAFSMWFHACHLYRTNRPVRLAIYSEIPLHDHNDNILLLKQNLITTQAKLNLSSRSGIGGIRSAT